MVAALCAVAALLTGCASTSTSQGTSLPTFTNDLVHKLSANYQVATGYPKLYTKADCSYTYPDLLNCLGNNPAAPYIVPIAPTFPDEYSDPALKDVFGPTHPGTSGTYRLDPREAIVLFGTMPPPGRYMSLVTYVATRQASFDTSSPEYQAIAAQQPSLVNALFLKLPNEPTRIESFSSVGDPINNVNIAGQSGGSFGTFRYFIITPDEAMDHAVRSALGQMGVPAADIFTEPVSYAGMRLGLNASADDFVSTIRYALPDDPNAGDQWRNTLPLSVMAVRERSSSTRAAQPFPTSAYAARSVTSEAPYSGNLHDLIDAACRRWTGCSTPTQLVDLYDPPVNLIGGSCRPINENCLGDTNDTPYFFSNSLPLDHGEIYAVVDTLATETGNAAYVSMAINDASKFLGVAAINDPDLKGSAGSYSPNVKNTDKFFVYYLTRDCAGLQNLTGGKCLSITNDMLPPGTPMRISLRDYIRPGTARGPNSAQLLAPVVMQVTRPS
jgi:hypothetical protein